VFLVDDGIEPRQLNVTVTRYMCSVNICRCSIVFGICVLHFNSLQPVVLRLSSIAKTGAVWIFQHIVMVIGSVVMGVMKRTVV